MSVIAAPCRRNLYSTFAVAAVAVESVFNFDFAVTLLRCSLAPSFPYLSEDNLRVEARCPDPRPY